MRDSSFYCSLTRSSCSWALTELSKNIWAIRRVIKLGQRGREYFAAAAPTRTSYSFLFLVMARNIFFSSLQSQSDKNSYVGRPLPETGVPLSPLNLVRHIMQSFCPNVLFSRRFFKQKGYSSSANLHPSTCPPSLFVPHFFSRFTGDSLSFVRQLSSEWDNFPAAATAACAVKRR